MKTFQCQKTFCTLNDFSVFSFLSISKKRNRNILFWINVVSEVKLDFPDLIKRFKNSFSFALQKRFSEAFFTYLKWALETFFEINVKFEIHFKYLVYVLFKPWVWHSKPILRHIKRRNVFSVQAHLILDFNVLWILNTKSTNVWIRSLILC